MSAWAFTVTRVDQVTGLPGVSGSVTVIDGGVGGVGPAGPQGEPGPQGPAGPAGADGAPGLDGADGAAGPAGPQGPQGEPGPAGADGADSTVPGPAGPAGPEGPTGPEGPAGPAGADSTVPGPEGPAGPAGTQGDPGPAGDPGPQGEVGPAGPAGDTGATGPAGPEGPQGPQGEAGPAGPAGPAGDDGVGVPVGGTTGQVLAKVSATDFDTEWVDQSGGGGGGTVESVVAGTGIAVDNSDPANPVVSATGGGGGGVGDVRARLTRSSNFAIPHNTNQAISFNVESYDTAEMTDIATQPTRITIKQAGVYLITARAGFEGNSLGTRFAAVALNGNSSTDNWIATDHGASGLSYPVGVGMTLEREFAVNDYLQLVAFQATGSSVNVQADRTYLTARRVA